MALTQRRTERVPYALSNFGGLNDDSNNAALDDRDLRISKNMMFYRERLIGGRFGYIKDPFSAALNSGAAITGIYDWHPDRDADPRPIFIAGDKIYEDVDGTATDLSNGAAFTAGANNVFTFSTVKGKLYGTNGVDVPFELDFADAADAEALPGWFGNNRKAKYFHSQFGYLFAAGFTGTGDTGGSEGAAQHPMGIQHSEYNDANTWLEANNVEKAGGFATFGDEYVTGIYRHRDFMMIGTNKRTYPVAFTGDIYSRFAIQRALDVGLAHQRAVVSINGEYTFFMDPQGHVHQVREVARGFGDVGVSRSLSSKIRNYIANLNRTRIQYSHGAYLEDRGWVVFAVSYGVNQATHNDLMILDLNQFPLDEPDPRAARWMIFKNVPANAMAVLLRDRESDAASIPAVNGYQTLVFGTTTGWAKRFTESVSYDLADDDTQVEIETDMATKYFDFGVPAQEKSVVEAYFDVEPSSDDTGPTVTMEYDYSFRQSDPRNIDMAGNIGAGTPLGPASGAFVLDTDRLASAEQITRNRIAFVGAGTNVSMRLRKDLSGTEKWKMQQATLLVEQRGVTPENP
jgi:hypothetical protein